MELWKGISWHEGVRVAWLYQKERLAREAETHMVPVAVERLVRYETMLSREIDRTLNQLERLQRRRRGEGDLPPDKLDLTS